MGIVLEVYSLDAPEEGPEWTYGEVQGSTSLRARCIGRETERIGGHSPYEVNSHY